MLFNSELIAVAALERLFVGIRQEVREENVRSRRCESRFPLQLAHRGEERAARDRGQKLQSAWLRRPENGDG